MTSSNVVWSTFTRKIYINASVQDIYNAWTQSGKLSTWFLERADFYDVNGNVRTKNESIQKGDTGKWKWHGWNFEPEYEVLEANGKDRLCFTFGNEMKVLVTVTKGDKQSLLELHQYHIPTDEESILNYFNGCSLGWSFWMVNLKAWLEHGILLNDKNLSGDDSGCAQFVNA